MSRKHLGSLDGLRGVAILLVVVYHLFPHRGTGWIGYVSSGAWCGVDLFFVLSGFLITGILFDAQGTPHFYRNFYMRRVLRLLPVYLVFLAAVFLLERQASGSPWWFAALFILYGSNVVRTVLPNFQWGAPIVTGHLWSLALEEQFYMLWPWAIARLRTRRRVLRACLCGSLGALALRLLLNPLLPGNSMGLYFMLPTRADALLLGGAAAMLVRDPDWLARYIVAIRFAGVAAFAVFVALAAQAHTVYFASAPIDTWGFTLLALASVALLLCSLRQGSWSQRLLDRAVLRFFGRYSYGLYLFHHAGQSYDDAYLWPRFVAHLPSLWLAGTLHLLLVLGLSTGLAMLSFTFIEDPFLRMKRFFPETSRPAEVAEEAIAA